MFVFKRRFLFDAGGTTSDAGGNGAGANTATPPVSGGNQGASTDKQFTQGDIDRIIGERLARAEQSATEKLMKSLGVEKIEDAAAAVKARKDAEEAAKSELEKAADAKAKAEKDAADAKAALENERKARVTDRRNSRIETAAAAAGAIDPADVLAWAERAEGDLLAKVIKEDGAVDEKTVKELIEKAQKERAHFFGKQLPPKTPGSPSNAGGKTPSKPDAKKERFGDKPLVSLS